MHIVTGAPIPAGAEAVVRVEDVEARPDSISLRVPRETICTGQHIRRQGENLRAGAEVLPAGTLLHPAAMGALATCGVSIVKVFRQVRIGILTTGDEVVDPASSPEPWQIRNANAFTLSALFSSASWRSVSPPRHVPDDAPEIARELTCLLDCCDLIVLTGGVSMGDRDYVPETIRKCGCEVLFHKLPIRPGKPILGAIGPRGQAVLGLPGNPVSVLTTGVRFGSSVCRKLAGLSATSLGQVSLANHDGNAIKLWYSRPVTLKQCGVAQLISSQGSGDVPSAARSDGFVELPPGGAGSGPWPFYPWEI
jgi:molybdopterin molybdotransferase